MANTPPAAPDTSPPLPGDGPRASLTREDYSVVATAVARQHSASVVLVHQLHVASDEIISHGTGFIVWSSAKDYLILTANHVIKRDKEQRVQVEIVVKMPNSGDYLPATMIRTDASRDVALLRVTNNDGKTARPPLTFDDRLPPPVGTLVVLLGYFAPDGDVEGQILVCPDVPGSSPGKIISDVFQKVGKDDPTSKDVDNGLDEKIKANCPSIEGYSGSPLIADHMVVGLLTSAVHTGDLYATVPTLKAVFQRWLLLEETDGRTANDLIPLLAALEA